MPCFFHEEHTSTNFLTCGIRLGTQDAAKPTASAKQSTDSMSRKPPQAAPCNLSADPAKEYVIVRQTAPRALTAAPGSGPPQYSYVSTATPKGSNYRRPFSEDTSYGQIPEEDEDDYDDPSIDLLSYTCG